MKYFKYLTYAVVILVIVSQFKTCFIGSGSEVLRIDTVEVIKYIPSKQNTFKRDSLVYVYVNKYIDTSKQYKELFKKLEIKYKTNVDSLVLVKELLYAKRKRKYTETFKDSILDAEVIAYTTGELDSLQFKYKTKPLKIVTNEITKYVQPRFRVLAGADARTNGDIGNTVLGVNLGLQTRKGSIYTIGYDTEKNLKFSTYINLFDKY